MSERTIAGVLAATDGSARAEEAVRQGARLALLAGATLDVVFVVDTKHAHDADVEREAEAALARSAAIAGAVGVTAPTRVLSGEPSEAIVSEAADHGADLVCVGQDAGVLGGAIRVGSVAAHVMQHARCSVMLGREAGPSFPIQISCGVDGSEFSVATATFAAEIAAAAGAELRLLHVIPVFRGDNVEWTLDADEPSPPEIEPSVLAAASRGVVPVREMAMGRPEHALVAAASRDGVDLLVVGHRGLKGVRKALLGSVSEYAALHAPCSVLVARPEI